MTGGLTPLDCAFLLLEVPGSAMNIGALTRLDGEEGADADWRFDLIRRSVGERLGNLPEFTQRVERAALDLRWPVLVTDDHFDIDRHVRRTSLAGPGSVEQLDEVMDAYWSSALLRDRPLWQLLVVDGLASGDVVVALKVHHALADGVTGVRMLATLFDGAEVRAPQGAGAPPGPDAVAANRGRDADHWRRWLTTDARGWGRRRAAGVAALKKGRIPDNGTATFPSILTARRTSFCGTPGPCKEFRTLSASLPDAKRTAKSRDATVTDVILTVVGGALRRLMDERDEVLERDLIAFVPINVRGEGSLAGNGNHISAVLVALHADEVDPEKRLAAIARDSTSRAGAGRRGGARLLARIPYVVGPAFLAVGARLAARSRLFNLVPVANVMISSVPGSPVALGLGGARVRSVAPVGPLLAGCALNVTVLGYRDTLEFGVLAATNRVPDVALLCRHLTAEVNSLIGPPARSSR